MAAMLLLLPNSWGRRAIPYMRVSVCVSVAHVRVCGGMVVAYWDCIHGGGLTINFGIRHSYTNNTQPSTHTYAYDDGDVGIFCRLAFANAHTHNVCLNKTDTSDIHTGCCAFSLRTHLMLTHSCLCVSKHLGDVVVVDAAAAMPRCCVEYQQCGALWCGSAYTSFGSHINVMPTFRLPIVHMYMINK